MKENIKPATGRLGVLVVGVGGAVATTMITGTLAARKGLAKAIGSIAQMATMRMQDGKEHLIKDIVPLVDLNDIVFGGWDIFADDAYEAAMYAEVLKEKDLNLVKDELKAIKPMPAAFDHNFAKRLNGTHIKKPLSKCKLVFCGDTRNNVAYCLMYICAKLGIHYVGWGPKELAPAADVVEYCREVGKETGAVVEYGEDRELIKGADALYTDIWASMGEEDKIPERVKLLTPYKVTGEVLKATENPDCIFLHCLPSFHDFDTTMAASQKELGYDIREVTDEVFLSHNSKVFDEAENRMHTIKAVMVATIGNV